MHLGHRGMLGVRLRDLLSGEGMRWVLISNYMIDVPWLMSACPALASAEKLVFVHGEKDARGCA